MTQAAKDAKTSTPHKARASHPKPSAADPRVLARDLLRAVLRERVALDEAWSAAKNLTHLAPRDRAFARLLVTCVLRRLGQIDALIEHCLDRPLKARHAEVRDLLRLGTAQLMFLGTPAHAAVSTTLDLAQGQDVAGYKGLLNAVLRRVAREGDGLAADQDAGTLNTKKWLWQSWSTAYGEAAARAIAEAHLAEPPLDVTVRDPAALKDWAEALGAAALPTGSLRLPPGAGDVTKLPGFAEGAWWVQDAAAALPARLLGQVAGQRVLDICAAPGGKTAQLAAAGAQVTALDISAARVGRLKENLTRLGLSGDSIVADARDWRPAQPFEAVLLDAPCSATGTLRRHPDIAHLKGAKEVAKLTALQDRLLANAQHMVAPGGLLVYATCSLQPEEGAARIEAFLAGGAPFERVPLSDAEIGGLSKAITPQGDLRTLPCQLGEAGGLDGFYACRLRRWTGTTPS